MIPLRITTCAPIGWAAGAPIHLDALLARVVADRELPRHWNPPRSAEEVIRFKLPLARSQCDRYWMASAVVYSRPQFFLSDPDRFYVTQRFPVRTAFRLGSTINRIDETSGKYKAFRFPVERHHAVGGLLTWYCIGDREGILDLLSEVTHIGKKRRRGEGMLTLRGERWTVEPCEPWAGFPVLGREGEALRNLPLDTPGLKVFRHHEGRTEPPYYLPSDGFVAVPVPR